MNQTSLIEREKLKGKVSGLLEMVKQIQVKDKASLERAHKALVYIKGVREEINAFCNPNIQRLHEAHKEALAQKRVFERSSIEAENYIKPQVASYLAKLESLRREAEEKARREKEEVERKAREEEQVRVRAAMEAEEKGNVEEAKKILDQTPTQAPFVPQTVVPPKEKIQGLSIRKDWKWEVEDIDKVPNEYLCLVPDSEKITAYVKAMKEKAKIPGIRIFSKDTTVTRIKEG